MLLHKSVSALNRIPLDPVGTMISDWTTAAVYDLFVDEDLLQK